MGSFEEGMTCRALRIQYPCGLNEIHPPGLRSFPQIVFPPQLTGRDDEANQGPPALIPRPRGNPGVAQDPSGCGSTTQAWKHFRWTARRLGSSEGLRNAYYVLERVHKKRALRLFNEQHVLQHFTRLFEGMTADD